MKRKVEFPRIKERGWKIVEVHGCLVVPDELIDSLPPSERDLFDEYYGCQTRIECGPFACDVEAVLERMASGRKIGTQSEYGWD